MMCPFSRKNAPRPASKTAGPGRPKDLGKRAAILEAAKALFVEQGYTGVSMDAIAAQAGVSKLTVYSHFGDKESLFGEAVTSKCVEMLPDTLFVADAEGPLRDQLLGIGAAFFELVTSDAAVSVQRVMMAPETDDRLREMFWQAGPRRTTEALAEFLRARTARGELDIQDFPTAALQLMTLVKGELHTHMMCGLQPPLAAADAGRHVAASVDFFLRAYVPRPAQAGPGGD
ncbi:MAG: TetR/AcrR family transcriptional regulator [Stenotrophomonas sp.]|uniref:TetR/AcrR family transcriptional regulator n=1 Tax=Stenotrophomonas TaxID=40323 RepID=UPI000C33CC4C|nr:MULTISPECIES: TetR/AcrR family transcriptional regulator [unclassified Stenotrophomonas]MDX3933301.1 TetR/AcrR family transcriptional regulator [Stenotrophomonas sp.]PKH74718.1 TetR family transcriptional regulator [Stenotrophomonas sp. Betaine-02u-21]PKH76567.1 TetR family transcriptional regulator [Stenotrophomonas sp. Betaine-02u-23]PKH97003.1 TetR family transcriptional regulator [Stenotrophomonas sp. Bg11-02]